MKQPNILLYIDNDDNEEDRGYFSKNVICSYTIHLYHEQNFPLKCKESKFWDKICYNQNKVRKFFEKL